jgi:hypothetical protein
MALDMMIEQQERELAALRARLLEQDKAIELLLGACGAISALRSDEALAQAAEQVRKLQSVRADGMRALRYWGIEEAVHGERLWLSLQVPPPPKDGAHAPNEFTFEWRTSEKPPPGSPLEIDGGAVLAVFRGPNPVAAVTFIQRRGGEPVIALRWTAGP